MTQTRIKLMHWMDQARMSIQSRKGLFAGTSLLSLLPSTAEMLQDESAISLEEASLWGFPAHWRQLSWRLIMRKIMPNYKKEHKILCIKASVSLPDLSALRKFWFLRIIPAFWNTLWLFSWICISTWTWRFAWGSPMSTKWASNAIDSPYLIISSFLRNLLFKSFLPSSYSLT